MASAEHEGIDEDSSDGIIDYNEEWLYCIRANELDDAVSLLKERLVTNLNVLDSNNNGALHYCAANNLPGVALFLLKECKLDYCLPNSNGNTPLQWAVQTNSTEAVKQILLHDYDVHRAEYGEAAASEYFSSMVRADVPDQYKLDHETKLHYNIVEYSDKYAEENRVDLLKPNAFGKTILNDAFNAKDQDILHAILEHPAAAVLDESKSSNDKEEALPVERVSVDGVSGVIHTFRFGACAVDAGNIPEVRARELEIQHEDILNSNCAELDRSGQVIWETDLVASQWFTALAKDGKFHNKKVIQLGSGCGVSSIALHAAALSFGKVPKALLLTDVSTQTMDNLKFNVELNTVHFQGNATIHKLDWTQENTWPRGNDGNLDVFDIIVGSDLVYESNLVKPLTNVIDKLLDRHIGELLYVYKEERQGSELLPEALKKLGFDVQTQRAPDRFLDNPLTSNDDNVLELFFPEIKTEGFTMLHARRPGGVHAQ